MATVRDLITKALVLLKVKDAYTPLANEEASDGLESLNMLIESLSLDGLLVYTVTQEDFNLTGGSASYTLGTGGTWNSARPNKIESAKYLVGNQEYDLHILTDQEWESLDNRSIGGFPQYLKSAGTYPLDTITLWPVPSSSDKVRLFSWKPITSFSAVTDVISLPPGYYRMLVHNLAIEMAPEYVEPSAAVVAIARESKAALKRINSEPLYLSCDAALLNGSPYPSQSDFLGGK